MEESPLSVLWNMVLGSDLLCETGHVEEPSNKVFCALSCWITCLVDYTRVRVQGISHLMNHATTGD